jgi:uncharacterized membrane protein YgcG
MGAGEAAELAALDLALDELAAGRGLRAEGPGDPVALAALAAELRAIMPAPPSGAAERGRAAFLAQAEALDAAPRRSRGRRVGRGWAGGAIWRRSLPLRVVALAAALLLLMAVPAAVARQARPGTALWPLRQAGQQVRLNLTGDPVSRAHLRLNTAGSYLAEGSGAGEERREDMADAAEDQIRAAQDLLKDVAGPEADAERARAERLLVAVEALEKGEGPDDRSGPGGGSDDDRSGGGDDRSGSGSGGGSPGSGSGTGSGSGSSRSGSSEPGDD